MRCAHHQRAGHQYVELVTAQPDRLDPQLPDQGPSRPVTTAEFELAEAARRVIDGCTDAPDVESDGVHTAD